MNRIRDYWTSHLKNSSATISDEWWDRKKELCATRKARIVQLKVKGNHYRTFSYEHKRIYEYLLHISLLIQQKGQYYLEEQIIPYQFQLQAGNVIEHRPVLKKVQFSTQKPTLHLEKNSSDLKFRTSYNRLDAVKYAERWWNEYNPRYKKFSHDCTNYVSQCLYAGGAPMRGSPDRLKGWWYTESNWSYSWAVSHSLRWYLSGSQKGLQGIEVKNPEDLLPGDVICYDFQGDGRWDHVTIVVAKDAYGMPLVNAHTDNSRNRYWSYEDSTAWTPNIQYKFFKIDIVN